MSIGQDTNVTALQNGLQPYIFNHDVARVAVNGANGGEDSGDEEAQDEGVQNMEHIPEVCL